MYRVILLSVGVAMMVAGDYNIEDNRKCGRTMHHAMMCCKRNLYESPRTDDFKECFKLPPKPQSCDFEICAAQKLGYASSDGTIVKEKLVEDLENRFKNATDFVESVKKNCVDGELSLYGEEDFCELKKLKICSSVQYLKICDDWTDEGECKGAKKAVAECIKKFD